ncbi:GIY-YIG nuclease family protein [Candidatus Roizmanbacteria bacterium]|nr:GIY-YIG nuclease family protein [Candidatus Roizmanbacteria bacterium]
MYYFYILRCADSSLYCGQTNNLKRRVNEHNFDKKKSAKYLRGKTPVELVYFEELTTLQEAMKREIEIKKWPKSKKEALVQGKRLRTTGNIADSHRS